MLQGSASISWLPCSSSGALCYKWRPLDLEGRGEDEGHRDGKMEILVYICPFPSQAIFHGDLRIVRMGRIPLLTGPIRRKLLSGGICDPE